MQDQNDIIYFCSDAADYGPINASNNPLVPFTFIGSTHRQCFDVTIIDDKALEDTEVFSLNLAIGNTTGQELNITVKPNFSLVEIKDQDGICLTVVYTSW